MVHARKYTLDNEKETGRIPDSPANIIKIEYQLEKKVHFRFLLLFAFNEDSRGIKVARDICAIYGDGMKATKLRAMRVIVPLR
ncbi:hypothetical protein NPIL_178711 [Nephila pilipes]|uniref:Uncharacterized protein n=1 Tax=Nephila pilipes TaxID=299642 RepID=A0A8X6N4C8_NEPPI|nr:hypothetical protein NPIL_178711 [Nephila pilipes]